MKKTSLDNGFCRVGTQQTLTECKILQMLMLITLLLGTYPQWKELGHILHLVFQASGQCGTSFKFTKWFVKPRSSSSSPITSSTHFLILMRASIVYTGASQGKSPLQGPFFLWWLMASVRISQILNSLTCLPHPLFYKKWESQHPLPKGDSRTGCLNQRNSSS